MALTIYYENDAPIDALKDKTAAVVGYGSQGHAHSQNLRDSGVKVVVAELEGTDNFKLAWSTALPRPISRPRSTVRL